MGLEVRRRGFHLGPLNVSFGPGITTLVGRNGAGKSTLLKAVVGLETLSSGSVEINGAAMGGKRARRMVMRGVGYVPQASAIPGPARVGDVLAYAAWLKGLGAREVVQRVPVVLDELAISELEHRRVGSLSGGERQRVSIAMSLVHQPTILILDEPSINLDPIQRLTLRKTIDDLAEQRTVIVSTHLVEDLRDDDAVLVLAAGGVVFSGRTDGLRLLAEPGDLGSNDLERGLWRVLGGEAP